MLRQHPDNRNVFLMPLILPVHTHTHTLTDTMLYFSGRLSNVEHGNTPIGSPQRNRWLGNRPRSGLWKRKDGRHGRKIKPPKPVKQILHPSKFPLPEIKMTMKP